MSRCELVNGLRVRARSPDRPALLARDTLGSGRLFSGSCGKDHIWPGSPWIASPGATALPLPLGYQGGFLFAYSWNSSSNPNIARLVRAPETWTA